MIFVFDLKPADASLVDPLILAGRELDDSAAAWGRRLQRLPGAFRRSDGEPDASFRPRVLDLIRSRVEG